MTHVPDRDQHVILLSAPGAFALLNNAAYQSSKTAVDMLTILYAKELRDAGSGVSAVGPGYRATEPNGGGPTPGAGDPADGAAAIVRCALAADCSTGDLVNDDGQILAW